MKKIIRFIPLLIMIAFSTPLFANKVIVKGYITDANKKAIANKKVKISTDSLNTLTGCMITHTVVTNPNGYYIDTLSCSGDIRKLKIVVENCNGTLLINDPQVPTSNIVESNFVVCTATTPPPPTPPIPTTCKAYFTYSVKDSSVSFNSEKSVGSSSTDSITSRTWYFFETPGSNTNAQTINALNPSIKFPKPGTYLVTLVIKTKSGCSNTFTDTVVIKAATVATGCKAIFGAIVQGKTVKFNSIESSAKQGDSIISRTWSFGDSTANLIGNRLDPSHEYSKAGIYNVCMSIKSKYGCENKYCLTVTIKDSIPTPPNPPSNCKAFFNYKVENQTVYFNSKESVAPAVGDSIISRNWTYGDGSPAESGNRIDPKHVYTKGGVYTALLYIKTKLGCESRYTVTVQVPNPPCALQVQFTTERLAPKKVKFNSSLSTALNDSIVQRTWKFGDNSTLTGNQVSPTKEYPIQGVYTACLQIKTLRGCIAEVCKPVVVQDSSSLPPTNNDYIRIVSINPNPVQSRMILTVWSRNSAVDAEIAVYDIYGLLKFSLKKQLVQGNTVIEISAEQLPKGPYYLKVSTKNAKESRVLFYKL